MPQANKLFSAFLIVVLTAVTVYTQENSGKKFYEMSNKEIDSVITETSKTAMTVTEKIKFYSDKFLGMPYNLTCSGDGPDAIYETQPLVNFKETNCMVYCEHVLALSISDSWDNFFNNLQQIRYKDGMIGMRTRNHYTMGDWLPENEWLLHDVTQEVGGDKAVATKRTISHEKFFKGKGIADMRYVLHDREITRYYIPFKHILKIESNMKNGDILSLIFANKDDIFSAHMLIAIRKDGKLYIRESAMSRKTTFDRTLYEWLKNYIDSYSHVGLAIMRVNNDLNKPGKIILPWEIGQLKNKN